MSNWLNIYYNPQNKRNLVFQLIQQLIIALALLLLAGSLEIIKFGGRVTAPAWF